MTTVQGDVSPRPLPGEVWDFDPPEGTAETLRVPLPVHRAGIGHLVRVGVRPRLVLADDGAAGAR